MNELFCVITGDPIGGITIYGPFKNCNDAIDWAEHFKADTSWWVTELHSDITTETYQ